MAWIWCQNIGTALACHASINLLHKSETRLWNITVNSQHLTIFTKLTQRWCNIVIHLTSRFQHCISKAITKATLKCDAVVSTLWMWMWIWYRDVKVAARLSIQHSLYIANCNFYPTLWKRSRNVLFFDIL